MPSPHPNPEDAGRPDAAPTQVDPAVDSAVGPAVEVRLLSHPTYLAGSRELVIGIARRLGFDDNGAGKIALATDEALANVINHGYKRQPDRPIWIRLWPLAAPNQPGIRIVIEDEAPHIDPEAICGRDLADVKPGGLGVHIIKEVMDVVEYSKRSPVGMRLTMIKRLTPRAADPTADPTADQSTGPTDDPTRGETEHHG
ncbi:MAG: ATP-binding protein [Planctomycetota bacterium]